MKNMLVYRGEQFDANFYYFAGVDIDHAFFLQKGKKRILLVPKMNEAAARETFRGTVVAYKDAFRELRRMLSGTVGVDERNISLHAAKRLKKICRLENASENMLQERMRKKKEEINAMAKATRLTREILDNLELKEGIREEEVKKQLLQATLEEGAGPAFEPIVATAKNARFPHYQPGKARLKDMVLIDYGVKYDRYCSDVTRCFFLRKNKKMEEAYEKCRAVSEALLDEMADMRTGNQVARAADALMKRHGLPSLIHSIGHGVGLDVHEYPRLNTRHRDPIKGTVMAIEPAAYFPSFGVRFENTIAFNGKKARIL
ncbi:MAG TPA: M24 family metallopeptidase [Candidatus Bilamarchaeaceae archaeon]|nr:M24 family metallopeptidase [Candidatus Bilamarchaeaceae archaeon]